MMRITPTTGLVAALLTSFMSSAFADTMTEDEIHRTFPGKSFTFMPPNGATGTLHYYGNGDSRLSDMNYQPHSDRGSWRIKNDQFCNSWCIIRRGREKCFTMTKPDRWTFENSDGAILKKR